MPFDFGSFDIGSLGDLSLGDIDFGFDLDSIGSITTDVGTEFMSSFPSLDAFEIPSFDVASLGGFDVAGSFAGSASWFDTFNPGAILDSIPSVSDFSLGSLTDSLPSLSSIKSLASTVSNDLGSIVKTAQAGLNTVKKITPLVNVASSALGIQNPLTPITQAAQQALGVAGAAAGITNSISGAATGVNRLLSTNIVSAGASALGISPATATSLTARATNLFTTEPTSANAVDKATGLPINTPREVDANGLVILNAAETAQLTRNAPLVNSLVDPATSTTTDYAQAVANRSELLASQEDTLVAIAANERIIKNANLNIEEMQQNLLDPDLSDAQRTRLQDQITANQATIAEATDALFTDQQILNDVNSQLETDQEIITQGNQSATTTPAAVDQTNSYYTTPSVTVNTIVGNPDNVQAVNIGALVGQAKNQQTLRDLRQNKAQSSDWRVRLRLAPGATYLYNDPVDPGILSPLSAKTGTDGVIFPYTPAIETAYKANYDTYDLTHSNFRGYFYRGSYVDAVNMRCTFTAQDTSEANYLLAVIHFFRSVTKMFYGQDAQRGSPPPMVFLSGLGDYQFNEHPCVVSQFNYTLPPDVDYVRAYSTLDMSTNLLANRTRTSISGNPLSYGINRLLNSGLFSGAIPSTKAPGNLEIKEPTYVPTKMEISITLLPMQSRQQVSTQFSLKGFANGNLLKGGFW